MAGLKPGPIHNTIILFLWMRYLKFNLPKVLNLRKVWICIEYYGMTRKKEGFFSSKVVYIISFSLIMVASFSFLFSNPSLRIQWILRIALNERFSTMLEMTRLDSEWREIQNPGFNGLRRLHGLRCW